MTRKKLNYSHGDTGTKPDTALDFKKGGRPSAGNFDWYWYNVSDSIAGHADEFDRLDSNDDGIVDEADTLTAGGNLKGDLNAPDGETIWSESGGYIPQAQLQNNSVSVNAGNGLTGGSTLTLGDSTTLNVSPSDFAGSGIINDGSDKLALEENSFTVAGNSVALGGSVTIGHGDLSDAPANAHHKKYTDSEAVSAVNAVNSLDVDIAGAAENVNVRDSDPTSPENGEVWIIN